VHVGRLWRLVARELRSRRDRALALGLGILVASVSFSLLTAAVSTSQLAVRGTVARSFRPAYDILVRPPSAVSPVERREGLVRDNYLAGTFGGISIAQWQKVLHLPGVQVAAPIANIGYVVMQAQVIVPVTGALTSAPDQLFRVRVSWLADNGLSAYPGGTYYVYYTPTAKFVALPGSEVLGAQAGAGSVFPGQVLPDGHAVPICDGFTGPAWRSPWDTAADSSLSCWSGRSMGVSATVANDVSPGTRPVVGAVISFSFPMLVSAIDPVQESRLVGLDHTIVAGHYLGEQEGLTGVRVPGQATMEDLPVIAASRTFLDESMSASVQRLVAPPGADVPAELAGNSDPAAQQAARFLSGLGGPVVARESLGPGSAYAALLDQIAGTADGGGGMAASYWTSQPTQYRQLRPGLLAAVPAPNPASIWSTSTYQQGFMLAPPGNQDTQYRRLAAHQGINGYNPGLPGALFHVVTLKAQGRFDPGKLPGFDPLSRVPLETYYPPLVQGGNARSARLLDGRAMGPTMNLGGYVAQPPLLLTTLTAAEQMLSRVYSPVTRTDAADLVSAIRVRVADVHGFAPADRARILAVASEIRKATGLQVDITAGSSPTTVKVELPSGCCGRPGLVVAEGWVRKGAALVVLNAIDTKSLALFVLVLVVCAAFLANGAWASVRSRRAELGILACTGWGRPALFGLVLGELAATGLAAGVAGAGLAAILAAGLRLDLPLWRAALVIPIAVGLACLAGAAPALAATRGHPLDVIAAVPAAPGRRRPARRPVALAWLNLSRRPARVAAGAVGLFFGVAAFAVLLSIQLAYRGQVVDTALGQATIIQVRAVDLIAAVLALVLGALSVADVLAVNLRERAAEQAVLAAVGWRPVTLAAVAAAEGLGVGLCGIIAGALAGLGLAIAVTGDPAAVAGPTALAAAAATVLVASVLVIPAWQAARTAPARALAEE
jgi:putative ABC transport system permease protein